LTGFYEETKFMARIPEDEIERLKSEVSVERLVEAAGIELAKSGRTSSAAAPSTRTIRPRWW
jgi:hypothetical protein